MVTMRELPAGMTTTGGIQEWVEQLSRLQAHAVANNSTQLVVEGDANPVQMLLTYVIIKKVLQTRIRLEYRLKYALVLM
jgi:hypothetical protein